MKLNIKILHLAFAFISLITFSSSRLHRSNSKKWLFDSFFKWESASFTVSSDVTKGEFSFSGKINSNERGVYFKEITQNSKDTLNFMEEATYKHMIDNVESMVLDYQLIPGCTFKRIDDSFFSGFKFTFNMRNFQKPNYKSINYKIQIAYKWGSATLGSVDPLKIINGLKKNCQDRQTQIEKQRIETKKEEERRRIEAETLKKQQEIQLAEEQRKKEEEAKKAEEAKRLEEQKKKFDAAKAETEKKAEEERMKKLQEEQRINEENRKKQEDAKKAEVVAKLDIAKKEEERKSKEAEAQQKKLEEQAKFDAEEKKNLEIVNTVRVLYNCGYGKAIYITGEDANLGSWQTAYKLNVINAEEWQYRSNYIKDGMTFKMIIYNWIDGHSIDLKTIPAKYLVWENKQGKEGNKIMKFVDKLMNHTPGFSRRMKKKLIFKN